MQGNSIVIQLFFNIISAKTEEFTISWDELFYSLLVDSHVLSDQPLFLYCFHVDDASKILHYLPLKMLQKLLGCHGRVQLCSDNTESKYHYGEFLNIFV
jgi:hypothetical protein